MVPESINEERILVLAPKGRDAHVIEQVLTRGGSYCKICVDYDDFLQQMELPAGAALIVEEVLYNADLKPLVARLACQPSWSDFPFIVLTTKLTDITGLQLHAVVKQLGNVVMLERPFNAETLRSAVASALRARRRQYQARSDLQERMDLNATLEIRIAERTAELAQANDRLMREMNERERAQMALVQTQKMEALGQLTSGISHDFNNLLSIILGNAELIPFLNADEQIKRIADTISTAAQQGSKLTRQLLAFSRGQPLNLRAFDVNRTLEEIKDFLKASLGASIDIHLDLTPTISHVKADMNQIELAVLNLAINAKDAMQGGGLITIRTEMQEAADDLTSGQKYAVVSVMDNGEGIKPEIIDKVFNPFFTTKPLGKGTGLGLSQVYGIANQSGGTAKIKSEVGIGTTVEIWLPFASESEINESLPKVGFSSLFEGKGARVLVVEDEPRVREFIVESLQILGCQVTQAPDAQTGLRQLEAMRPDLLITDFLMPGMNGAELVKQAQRIHPGVPAIIATGYADLQAIDEVVDRNLVLPKPFQLTELVCKVQQALRQSGLDENLVNAT